MATKPAQLLQRLEPPVRPAGAAARARQARRPVDEQDFDSLLALVAHGDISSGRRVQCDCELSHPLDDEQLVRLASAADQAEAAGATRAVMIIDGRALVMDVPQRIIDTEVSAPGSAKVFSSIDAAVYVPGPDEDAGDAVPPFPGGGLVPGPVARQLERALLFGDAAASSQNNSSAIHDSNDNRDS